MTDQTGYTLCGLRDPKGNSDACDRRRGHLGAHTWAMSVPKPPKPHGCLEDRVTALEKLVADLRDQVRSGPDPRLWAGDPHDGGYR